MYLLPKRRWLRFSLSTLLIVVTIFCVWLGWQVSIVRERKELRAVIEQRGGAVIFVTEESWRYPRDPSRPPLPQPPPIARRWLGDQSAMEIRVYPESLTAGETSRLESAFPEAMIRAGI